MLRRFLFLSLLLTVGGVFSGCRVPPSRPAPAVKADASAISEAEASTSSARLARAHAHFAAGVIHEMNDEAEAALQEYYQAALNDPENEGLQLDVTRRLLQNKQYEKSLELLTQATARPKASGAIYARLGVVYSQMGKYQEAASASRIAIKKSPGSLSGYQTLFFNYLQNKQPQEALKVLEEASKQPGADAEFLVGVSELYANFTLQNPSQKEAVRAKALTVLERAEKLKSPNVVLQFRLADGFNGLGETGKASRLYLDLLKHLPDVPLLRERLHARLASIYLRDSDRKKAVEQLEAIVRDDPTNPQAYYYLGYLNQRENKAAEAAEYYRKTILLDPNSFPEAYFDLALCQMSLKKPDEALATLEQARKKLPQTFAVEFYTGLAHTEKKDYAKALRYYIEAEVIAKATDAKLLTTELYFQLGATSERIGDFQQAEAYFEKCLDLAPDNHEAQNYLGYMWAERGIKLDKARELIDKAVKAEPKNPAFLDSLGWVFFKLNRPQEALEYVQKAVELSTEPDPTLLDHLGDIFGALNQPEKAREAWTHSLSLQPNEEIRKKLAQHPGTDAPGPKIEASPGAPDGT
jgi:tetratricopeptide (TPR) repeat protein